MRKLGVIIVLSCVAAGVAGCNTYRTSRVPESGSVRGYPFVFMKPYIVTVTYDDNTESVHVLSVPTLYAVDSERAALGLTKTEFENGPDGFALKTKTDLDQKIPENLKAVTELLKELGVTVTGAPAPGSPPAQFQPDLLAGNTVRKITLQPI